MAVDYGNYGCGIYITNPIKITVVMFLIMNMTITDSTTAVIISMA